MTYEYAFWYLLGVYALTVTLAKTNGFDYADEFAIAIVLGLVWPVSLLLGLCLVVAEKCIEWRKS